MRTRLAAVASAALVGALAGASCTADNRASIETQAICAPTKDCTFQSKCEAQYIGFPSLDQGASTDDAVWLLLQVANQLPNNEDLGTGRLNTNDAHIDEAAIEYEGALGGAQTVGSNYLVPASGSSVVSVKMNLTGAVGGTAARPNEVIAHVRLRGYLDDGTRFEAGDFPITIQVCASGCAANLCGGAPTCPPSSEGQRPLGCIQ